MKALFNTVLFGLLLLGVCNYPPFKHHLTRKWVDSRVVRVTEATNSHGGTGFYIKAKSGKSYIITNAHVCALGRVFVSQGPEKPVERKIIEISKTSDLCLIEPLKDISGLELSSKPPKLGDCVSVIGHPFLYFLYESTGCILAMRQVEVFDRIDTKSSCNQPKDVYRDGICFVRVVAYEATNSTYPGNSGSPVVDSDGQIVALVFADVISTHWGLFITWADLNNLLRDY